VIDDPGDERRERERAEVEGDLAGGLSSYAAITAANDTEIALERKRKTGMRCATAARMTRSTNMSGSSEEIRRVIAAIATERTPAAVTRPT